jgi:hypothetical protein
MKRLLTVLGWLVVPVLVLAQDNRPRELPRGSSPLTPHRICLGKSEGWQADAVSPWGRWKHLPNRSRYLQIHSSWLFVDWLLITLPMSAKPCVR